MTSAPASAATRTTSSAYARLLRYPSKKCSASRNTRCPSAIKWLTESRIISRFSSRDVLSAKSTWRSKAFATKVTAGAPESRSAPSNTSSAAFTFGRRVAPKATKVAFFKTNSFLARAKNSVSLGFAPGQPPSINPTPRSSKWRAIANLS